MSLHAVESGNEWPPGVQPPEGLPTTPIRAVVDVTDGTHVPEQDPPRRYRTKRRERPDGYVDLYRPGHPLARRDGYVFEHRLVAYEAGLLADPTLHVHHRNHDKADNRLENLEVLSVDDHARHHAQEDGVIANQYGTWALRPPKPPRPGPRPCLRCGTEIPDEARTDKVYCSSRCVLTAWKARKRAERGAA